MSYEYPYVLPTYYPNLSAHSEMPALFSGYQQIITTLGS